jgi:hypothetical protein
MGLESGHNESSREIVKDPIIALQKPLALIAAGLSIDEMDKTKRNHAMKEWIEHDAAPFREYVEMHPEIHLDPNDLEGMKHLIEEIRTLH